MIARNVLTMIALASSATQAHAQTTLNSFVFNDVIASNGRGDIDLFAPKTTSLAIDGPLLEAFRQDNNGSLVFAVDVNEASSGSESSSSQGLAISQAVLIVTIDGQERQYSEFSTPTRSLLMAKNASARDTYYTLIGTAGSNRVSPNADSELTGSSLDETLHFPVADDLSGATTGRLEISLLDTDTKLGDPEAFYDYSNGFEEVALLSRDDVLYLEALAPGRNSAPLVIADGQVDSYSWAFYPAAESYYIASYEDLYPNRGDYDFNDLVVAYQVAIGSDGSGAARKFHGHGYLIARGGEYEHDWHLGIELPSGASGDAVISLFAADSHTPMGGYPQVQSFSGSLNLRLAPAISTIFSDGASTYVNSFPEQQLVRGPRFEFEVTLDAPVSASEIGSAPFDPFLFVHDTSYEIHLVDKTPVLNHSRNTRDGHVNFLDGNGYPFAMVVVDEWNPPLAAVDMGLAYPEFVDHVRSNGVQNAAWYQAPEGQRIKSIPRSHWRW